MKPITRKEQFIQAAADGTTPPKPLTREELILSGADVTPLTRDEYFAEMQSGGGGGSYPVYEGTIGNIFGDSDAPADLLTKAASHELLLCISFSIEPYGDPFILISNINASGGAANAQIKLDCYYTIGGELTLSVEYKLDDGVPSYVSRSYQVIDEGSVFDRSDNLPTTTPCVTTFVKNPFYVG